MRAETSACSVNRCAWRNVSPSNWATLRDDSAGVWFSWVSLRSKLSVHCSRAPPRSATGRTVIRRGAVAFAGRTGRLSVSEMKLSSASD